MVMELMCLCEMLMTSTDIWGEHGRPFSNLSVYLRTTPHCMIAANKRLYIVGKTSCLIFIKHTTASLMKRFKESEDVYGVLSRCPPDS